MKASELLKLVGRPIAYYKDLSRPLGGATAAILFSQLFYWSDKTNNPLGIYKKLEELCEETGLTLDELRSARKKLVMLGVLIETYKRLEHRLYFKLDLNVFDELMAKFSEIEKVDLAEQEKPISRNGDLPFGEQGKTDFVIDQETTTLDYNNNNPLPPKGESAIAEARKLSTKLNQEQATAVNKNKNSASIDYDAVKDLFNQVNQETGERLPRVMTMNEDRRRKIKKFMAELKNPTLQAVENYFYELFKQLREFHLGKNDTGWKANFNWAIRPETVVKVREECL